MFWLLVAGVIAIFTWYFLIKPHRYWSERGVKQTKPWIFVGDLWTTLFRIKSFAEVTEWIYNMHPNTRYSGFYRAYQPKLLIKDPELIKQITVKDFDHFTDHANFIDPESDPLWAGNLFALKGQKWREMRATLSGSFTSSKMKNMYGLMVDTADNFVQYFLDKKEDLIKIEMKDAYTRFANDVIATTAFGIKVDSLTEPNNLFYLMGKEATNFTGFLKSLKFLIAFIMPKLTSIFKIGFFNGDVSIFFRNLIDETVKTREEKEIVRPDMINILLEARKGIKSEENIVIETGFATVQEHTEHHGKGKLKNLTNQDITSQALIFFFAGFDTVSTAMCFGSYELALNKAVQDKLRNEIIETYKQHDGNITYEVLLNMKYFDMVISEILRKWPPFGAVDRVCTKPYTIEPATPNEKPLHIEVGCPVMIPIHGLHRDPVYYPNPEKFDPNRFSDENKSSIKPYTYLPFGTGPRNCLGSRFALLETKVILFKLLLNFEIVPIERTQIPLKLNKSSFNNTAKDGFWLGLKRITN